MTTTWYSIPFIRNTPQIFSVQLLSVTYNMRTRYSHYAAAWMIDIADVDSVPIVGSIPLVTGCDLLEQYHYLKFGGGLYVYNSGIASDAVPNFTDLGLNSQLVFIPYGS